MSVFATYARPRYGRFLGVLVAVAAVVAGTVYFGNAIRAPLTASQLDAVAPSFTPVVARETVFPEPRAFDGEGVVLTLLAGGQGIAVRMSGAQGYAQAYMPSGETVSVTEGPVRIRGAWTGIDCSYANTLFDGQCTPTIRIESLEQLPIQLQ
jgi:hypothetical protein